MALGDRRDIRIDVTVDSDTRGGKQAAVALAEVDTSANRAGSSLHAMTDESKKLNVEIARTRDRVKELRTEIARTGDRSLLGDLRRERSALRDLERVAKEAGAVVGRGINEGMKAAGSGGGGVMDFAKSLPGPVKAGVIGGLVSAAALGAPTLGAMIAGVVSGAIGTGGIAGGVLMASHDPRVKAAAKATFEGIQAEFFRGTDQFVTPTIQSLGILQKAFMEMKVPEAFGHLVDDLPIIATGFGDLGKNAMPGVNAAFERMGGFSTAAAKGMGGLGAAVGYFADEVTQSPGAIMGLNAAFNLINNTIRVTGFGIKFLSNEYANMVGLGSKLAGIGDNPIMKFLSLGTSDDASKRLKQEFAELGDTSTGAANGMDAFVSIMRGLSGPTNDSADAMEALNDEFERSIDLQAAALKDEINFEEALDKVTESAQKFGNTLDVNTEAGRRNRENLIGAAQDARRWRDDQLELGKSVFVVNGALEANHQRLLDQAEAAGISRAAVEALIGALFAVPPITYADIVVNRTYSQGTSGGEGRRAAGGSAAAGGAYLVGDGGRTEVLQMGSQSGYIYPSVGAWQNAMGGGGSSGATAPMVNLTIPVYVGTHELRRIQIDDALNRGVPAATVAAAYP